MLDPASLERLRLDYANPLLTIRQVCAKHDVTEYELAKLRTTHNWQSRSNKITDVHGRRLARTLAADLPDGVIAACNAAVLDDDAPPDSSAAPETKAKTPTKRHGALLHRTRLMRRLYLLFDAKLTALETRAAKDTSDTATTNHDAEVRSLGHLIKQFDQLTDMSNAADKSARADASHADTASSDAERLRQDLMERFHKLRQSQPDQPAAQ